MHNTITDVKTIRLKVTPELDRLIEEASKRRGFPSRSEFLRYAVARSLEEELGLETIEEVFVARRQIQEGKTAPMRELLRDERAASLPHGALA